MKKLTIGKIRGLQRISSSRCTFTCLALDHRQNLRKALNPQNPSATNDEQISQFKLEVTAALAEKATAILLDPEVSAAQAVAAHAIPGGVGLVVALESTGYTGETVARRSQILPGWNVEKAKRMGADSVKLLVYYHPLAPTAAETVSFVQEVAEECQKYELVLMLEPLSYSLEAEKQLSTEEKKFVVIETARNLTAIAGVDILKAEFPLAMNDLDPIHWENACNELSVASRVPWILLSAAVEYETFLSQVSAACMAGASGIAVGRAVWKEAVNMSPIERQNFLNGTCYQRLSRLKALCYALARPWTDFYTTESGFDWYKNY
jgi:tagatose 1,6-diphosphate aldolase